MSTKFLMHLHFPDEPRINPWLGTVGDPPGYPVSPSFSDLMKRVMGAHTASRVLDPAGMIENIVNNLFNCSFSFYPETLSLLHDFAPNVYQRILDADLKSQERLGYGNAVATSFSGAILPLLSPEVIRLDIQLGIDEFEKTFQRVPKGFWCPELAISNAVADILIEKNILFTFVSPWQLQAISQEGTGVWKAVGPHPYLGLPVLRLKRPNGVLNLIVFNSTLHDKVLEGHILHQSQYLEEAIIQQQLFSKGIVVDAHHAQHFGLVEPYADMCLADLIHRTQKSTDFEWINAETLLQLNLETPLAKLKRGEGEFGTSWSCPHGLARWYRDCGCRSHSESTWNQHWRSKLKDLQLNTFHLIFQAIKTKLGENYFKLLMQGENQPLRYALIFALKGLNQTAWYYADPLQNPTLRALGNMLRSLELLKQWFGEAPIQNYISELSNLSSNYPVESDHLKNLLLQRERRSPENIASSIILHRVQGNTISLSSRGFWSTTDFEVEEVSSSSQTLLYQGKISLHDYLLDEYYHFRFSFTENFIRGLSLKLINSDNNFEHEVDFKSLDQSEGLKLTQWMVKQVLNLLVPPQSGVYLELKQLVSWFRFFQQPIPTSLQSLLQDVITRKLLELDLSLESWRIWDEELSYVNQHQIELDWAQLRKHLSHLISSLVSAPDSLSEESTVKKLELILNHVRRWNIEPDLTIPQNILWAQLRWWKEVYQLKKGKLLKHEKTKQNLLFHCAQLLGISHSRLEPLEP